MDGVPRPRGIEAERVRVFDKFYRRAPCPVASCAVSRGA